MHKIENVVGQGVEYAVMTPYTLVLASVETAGKTLQKILIDFPSDMANEKAHESMFTTHEAVNHLTECYFAFEAHLKGEEHQWGSFVSTATTFSDAVSELIQKRDHATKLLTQESDEATLTSALDYLVSHDWYHIGQLATNRQVFVPGWNSYALYS